MNKEGEGYGKKKAVFGIYRTQSGLENAVQMLRDERFSSSDVAVLLPESVSSRELGTQKASKAPEGATAGAGSGAVLGGILGWLVGMGSLAIPGVGPFIAAGPIVAALAGAGVGGAVGGLAGALVGMGIPEYEAKRYEGRLTEGLVIPLMAGVFQFHSLTPFAVIVVTVVAFHLITVDLLVPRYVGARLDIGPVAATIGFLFWGWLWGVVGLLLAVPLTAFVKLLADSNPAMSHLSNLLAREPQRFLIRRKTATISPACTPPRPTTR